MTLSSIVFCLWLIGASVLAFMALAMVAADHGLSFLRGAGVAVLTACAILAWPLVVIALGVGFWWFQQRGGLK